jgi:hypothetical protein
LGQELDTFMKNHGIEKGLRQHTVEPRRRGKVRWQAQKYEKNPILKLLTTRGQGAELAQTTAILGLSLPICKGSISVNAAVCKTPPTSTRAQVTRQ